MIKDLWNAQFDNSESAAAEQDIDKSKIMIHPLRPFREQTAKSRSNRLSVKAFRMLYRILLDACYACYGTYFSFLDLLVILFNLKHTCS